MFPFFYVYYSMIYITLLLVTLLIITWFSMAASYWVVLLLKLIFSKNGQINKARPIRED